MKDLFYQGQYLMPSTFWSQAFVYISRDSPPQISRLMKNNYKRPNRVGGTHDPPTDTSGQMTIVKDRLSPILTSLVWWNSAAHL